ncbi:uncharacterized protein BDR25DRAFT_311034 [Lindgomyces ingoldianus]|uniref:Uncharacterized protein n=1 Tax=Lindgomyces ingoldianus TaxID=673940 RepID=A0ACB6R5Y0_9PLEO|nr:uncharacterized protein BDR25DRAFT_311034 [Lindgomyces ingoldianus]KAF2474566.1 hypothetical protein BDR25DRAFT_311034 [Lindgomyces ingoldianus]
MSSSPILSLLTFPLQLLQYWLEDVVYDYICGAHCDDVELQPNRNPADLTPPSGVQLAESWILHWDGGSQAQRYPLDRGGDLGPLVKNVMLASRKVAMAKRLATGSNLGLSMRTAPGGALSCGRVPPSWTMLPPSTPAKLPVRKCLFTIWASSNWILVIIIGGKPLNIALISTPSRPGASGRTLNGGFGPLSVLYWFAALIVAQPRNRKGFRNSGGGKGDLEGPILMCREDIIAMRY